MQLYEPNLVSFRAGTRSAPAPSIMVPKALAHHAGPEVVVSAPPCTQLIRPTSPPRPLELLVGAALRLRLVVLTTLTRILHVSPCLRVGLLLRHA